MGETEITGWDFFIFIFSLLAIIVTETAFRKSSLGKLFFAKIVLGTSKHWSYHVDLLVFCPKFRLLPVYEYLNYYYYISNNCWTIPEKSKHGGMRTSYFKRKNPGSFRFVTLPLEIPKPKAKTHENST